MSNIIKVNFGSAESIENGQKHDQRSAADREALEKDGYILIGQLRLNGLKVRLEEVKEGEYTVFLDQLDPWQAIFRKTEDFGKAFAVYKEIAQHIELGDRTFDELSLLLSQKLIR